jgi:hypothetical protein
MWCGGSRKKTNYPYATISNYLSSCSHTVTAL